MNPDPPEPKDDDRLFQDLEGRLAALEASPARLAAMSTGTRRIVALMARNNFV